MFFCLSDNQLVAGLITACCKLSLMTYVHICCCQCCYWGLGIQSTGNNLAGLTIMLCIVVYNTICGASNHSAIS